ncbi:hypothetical protein LguiA_018056 [Lonicera macranthoides]
MAKLKQVWQVNFEQHEAHIAEVEVDVNVPTLGDVNMANGKLIFTPSIAPYPYHLARMS